MAVIPPRQALTQDQKQQLLAEWYALQQSLAPLRNREAATRRTVAEAYFPEPGEGSQKIDIGGGFALQGVFGIARKPDEAALDNVKQGDIKRLKLNLDALFPRKPSLSVKEYRKLNKAQREFVDGLLVISDEGLPKLEVVPLAAEDIVPATPEPAAPQATEPTHPRIHRDSATCAPGEYYTDGKGNFWQLTEAGVDWRGLVDPYEISQAVQGLEEQDAADTAAVATVATTTAAVVSIDDIEQAQPGDYYEDGDGVWWHYGTEGDWEQVPNPNQTEPVKKGRGRPRKAKA